MSCTVWIRSCKPRIGLSALTYLEMGNRVDRDQDQQIYIFTGKKDLHGQVHEY